MLREIYLKYILDTLSLLSHRNYVRHLLVTCCLLSGSVKSIKHVLPTPGLFSYSNTLFLKFTAHQ